MNQNISINIPITSRKKTKKYSKIWKKKCECEFFINCVSEIHYNRLFICKKVNRIANINVNLPSQNEAQVNVLFDEIQ